MAATRFCDKKSIAVKLVGKSTLKLNERAMALISKHSGINLQFTVNDGVHTHVKIKTTDACYSAVPGHIQIATALHTVPTHF